MESTRDIIRRIKSIKNIQQITRAMEMVAANRLKKAEARALSARPYAQNINNILYHLMECTPEKAHFFNPKKEVSKILSIWSCRQRPGFSLFKPVGSNHLHCTRNLLNVFYALDSSFYISGTFHNPSI